MTTIDLAYVSGSGDYVPNAPARAFYEVTGARYVRNMHVMVTVLGDNPARGAEPERVTGV